ncbi:LysR family transcriptional regulator [Providencia rettgeri]|nr:LysR family transcriptional regulator [Providencia rettgeri]
MDNLSALNIFVVVNNAGSFTQAGKHLGISASAVSKSISRFEQRLGVRLFHRSTRTLMLTTEGVVFLRRCRQILNEIESAEMELVELKSIPKGRLRISLPSVGTKFMSVLGEFACQYPMINLDIDYSDNLVDIIKGDFDAVIRTGNPKSSGLTARRIGESRRVIVGAPHYFNGISLPVHPEELLQHKCLRYRFPHNGKLDSWPFQLTDFPYDNVLPMNMVANSLDPLISFLEQGFGLACLPEMVLYEQINSGKLITVLDDYLTDPMVFHIVWPSSRFLSPKVRVFIDFIVDNLFQSLAREA